MAVLEELTYASVEDRHCLVDFVLDFGYPFGKAVGLLARLFVVRLLEFLDCHSNSIRKPMGLV